MPEKLTLNNGTVLEEASAIHSTNDLFLYIYGSDLKTVFDLLIEPENTEKITYTMNNGAEVVFEGFRKLNAVRDEGGRLITAVLRRED